jgi:hypothetical protein
MQHAHAFETVQDGCTYIEKINAPFLFGDRAHRKSMSGPCARHRTRLARTPLCGSFSAELPRRPYRSSGSFLHPSEFGPVSSGCDAVASMFIANEF